MGSESKKGRPKCFRRVENPPDVNYFKPRGIPLTDLESIELRVEELEALRLVHYERLAREEAAARMGVSRRTMERELKSGIGKVADALLNGKAIEIKGGYYQAGDETIFKCLNERHEWKVKNASKKPSECPDCGSKKIKIKKR